MSRRLLLLVPLLALGLALAATELQGASLWDAAGVRTFQGNAALNLPAQVVTTLGSEEFFLLLVSLVFWCIDKPLGIDLTLLLMMAGTANILLKALLQQPRPFWSDAALQLASGKSFSTPSGHAANSTVLFGYLAWWFAARRPADGTRQPSRRRDAFAVLSLVAISLVCLSRVYLGVHFPGDVIWGCAEGIVLLAAYVGLKPGAVSWLRRRSLGAHVMLAGAATATILALSLLFLAPRVAVPPALAEIYVTTRAQALGEAGSVAGLVFGGWVGLALESRFVRFAASGPAGKRVLRYVLGLAGLLAVWLAPQLLLPAAPLALGMAVSVGRYAATALWAVFAWPWLFVRIGLATVGQDPLDAASARREVWDAE